MHISLSTHERRVVCGDDNELLVITSRKDFRRTREIQSSPQTPQKDDASESAELPAESVSGYL